MKPEVIYQPQEMQWRALGLRREGKTIGVVPTMGALHDGHRSLMAAARPLVDVLVTTIFVNPAQFGPGEDLDKYPRPFDADVGVCREEGVDFVFNPTAEMMYGAEYDTYVELGGLTERLCGAFRPGHFRGVLSVVLKLLNIVPADRAYFGRKDFQQSVLIRRMVADLNIPVDVRVLPTVREADGLAMSSRNEYLSAEQRRQAVCLHEALAAARELFSAGETGPDRLIAEMKEVIARYPDARPQYVEIVAPDSLQAVEQVTEQAVAALAVFVGEVRLIDNMSFGNCPDVFVQAEV